MFLKTIQPLFIVFVFPVTCCRISTKQYLNYYQDQFSPNNINTTLREKVMGIYKMITNGEMLIF